MTDYNLILICMETAVEHGDRSKAEYYRNKLLNMTVEEAQETL